MVTGGALATTGAVADGGACSPHEPEVEGERGGHPRVRRLTRSSRRESGRQGAVSTGGELPRRPADGGGFGAEIRKLRGAPACAARWRRKRGRRGSRRAARRGGEGNRAPAASSLRRARVSARAETVRGRGRERWFVGGGVLREEELDVDVSSS